MLRNLEISPLLVDNLPELLAVAAAASDPLPVSFVNLPPPRVVKTAPENAPVPLRPETRRVPCLPSPA